jgi:hypothetical protein
MHKEYTLCRPSTHEVPTDLNSRRRTFVDSVYGSIISEARPL